MNQLLIASIFLLWVFLVLNLLLTLAVIRRLTRPTTSTASSQHQGPGPVGLVKGTQVRDFEAETITGEAVTVSDVNRGRKLFIFVTPSCEPCRALMVDIPLWRRQAAALDTELVVVSGGSRQDTLDFVDEFGLSEGRVIVAPQHSSNMTMRWGVAATPQYVLIQDGVVEDANVVATTVDGWNAIRSSLAEAPVAPLALTPA